jgi:hypothetical protein
MAVILSDDTFNRIMKVVNDYEAGKLSNALRLSAGTGILFEETSGGPDDALTYIKIGVNGVECP